MTTGGFGTSLGSQPASPDRLNTTTATSGHLASSKPWRRTAGESRPLRPLPTAHAQRLMHLSGYPLVCLPLECTSTRSMPGYHPAWSDHGLSAQLWLHRWIYRYRGGCTQAVVAPCRRMSACEYIYKSIRGRCLDFLTYRLTATLLPSCLLQFCFPLLLLPTP